jgi:mono/diheme cytochrome c family protein
MLPNAPSPWDRRMPLLKWLAPALVFLATALLLLAPMPSMAAEVSGELIYKTKCAACHGPQGEGTKKHKARLEGSRTAAQLVDLIRKTMPEDDPGTLSSSEAQLVAGYVYNSMYSETARQRNRPARIELARLTVRQYRQTVADLIGSFREPIKWNDKQGLKAEYFRGRKLDSSGRVLERVDPQVKFDFGTDAPMLVKVEAHEFSIIWNGSVLAPETGDYEFIVRT